MCGLTKRFMVKNETYDMILEIIVWSLRFCALGVFPSSRHDGEAWMPEDARRRALGGKPLGARALLVELRGDWAFYKQVLRLPGWSENKGCCWHCQATPQSIRDVGQDAVWRTQELTHWALLQRILEQGLQISPVFSAPGFKSQCIQIDWMHTADLGVSSDFLGNLFLLVCKKMQGASMEVRVGRLFKEMSEWYNTVSATSRLDHLTLTMVRQPGKKPKLRASAAETRALVPFGEVLAHRYLGDDDDEESTAKAAAIELSRCYAALSSGFRGGRDALARSSRRFALLSVALEKVAAKRGEPKLWTVKPKLHLFQEMCERGDGRPSLSWTYRDEDFGGSVGQLAQRRGGAHTVATIGRQLLLNFIARYQVPHFG